MVQARVAFVVLLVLLAAALLQPRKVLARDEGSYEPSAAARTMLEGQGFAVESGHRSRLASAYRWPTGPVFVTADAGLEAYLLGLRKLLIQRAGHGLDQVGPLLSEWTEALERSAPGAERDDGRRFVALLRRLAGDPEADRGLSDEEVVALDRELERLRAGDPLAPVPGLGTPLDRRPVASLWVDDWLGGPERWQVLVYVLTRGRCAENPRVRLKGTMPRRIERLLRAYVDGVGAAGLEFPGRHGLFDFELLDGRRFPPGVLRESADVVGIDLGARIGIPWARKALEARGLAERMPPVAVEPPRDSLRARFLSVLRELPDKPEGVPPMFESEAWQRLELQTVLGAEVLWRRAVGTASSPYKVFGAGDHPGFVHPDPDFWRALSVLAGQTASDARRDDVRVWIPPEAELAALEALVRRRIEEETPFTDQEKARLRACGFGGGWAQWEEWGGPRYHARPEGQAHWREVVERELLSERQGLPAVRRLRAQPRAPRCVRWLERLAEACNDLALCAECQLRGETSPKAAGILLSWGFLLEDIDGAFHEDPTTVCVRGLIDVDRALFQGVAGMDRLWVLYPQEDGPVLCRGSVFAYREVVSAFFVHEGEWRRRVGSDDAPRAPAWAASFTSR